ncbi:MAG: F510_1955 family glycosylhydrolase [Nitrososphaerota archaeon]
MKRKFLIAIPIAIAIISVIVVYSNLNLQQTVSDGNIDNTARTDARIVYWRHIHGLGIDPADRNILYIATHGDFYQSVNGGSPVKVDKSRADYMAFNAPPTAGVPLYSSGHPSTGGNTGLIKSTDGGQTWEVVAKVLEPPVDFHAMSVSKSDPNTIVGFDSGARGLFKTKDAGKTWNTLQYPDYISALAISPQDSEIIFAGTGKGIFQSNDGGKSWAQLNEYKGITILALSFDEEGVLYASNQFGLSRSVDLGKSWEKINGPDLTITSIAIDSVNKTIYVAGYAPEGYQEVFKSSDDATSWNLIGTNRESIS